MTNTEQKFTAHRDFTLSYFGQVLGEADSLQGGGAHWWLGGDLILSLDEQGKAETWDNWGDESDKMYAIVGYCAFHGIPLAGMGLYLPAKPSALEFEIATELGLKGPCTCQ